MKISKKNVTVLLDPGHAKNTAGKRMIKDGIEFYEYEFNRKVCRLVKEELIKQGVNCEILVPETEVDVKLTERANRANKIISKNPQNKHLFLSVHANAAGNGTSWMNAKGFSAWTTKGKTNSDKFAECLYDAADEVLTPKNIRIRTDMSDGDRDYEENFTVIYKANCPAVLTENLFYDNKDDVQFLLSDEGVKAIADVHVKGALKYMEKYF